MYLSDQSNSIIRGNNTFIKVKLFLKTFATNLNLSESDFLYSNIDEYQQIHLEGNCPQQFNGYDCGVYVIKFVQWITDKMPIASTKYNINNKFIDVFNKEKFNIKEEIIEIIEL
jgi:Ulp1 family protease